LHTRDGQGLDRPDNIGQASPEPIQHHHHYDVPLAGVVDLRGEALAVIYAHRIVRAAFTAHRPRWCPAVDQDLGPCAVTGLTPTPTTGVTAR
jgi:hypothetical protein